MKKIFVLATLVLVSILGVAQEESRHKFFVSFDMGASSFFNRSGISLIDHEQNRFSATRYRIVLGLDNTRQSLGIEYLFSEIGIRYNNNLNESVGIHGIGLQEGWRNSFKECFFMDYSISLGLLLGKEVITYNKKDFDGINRTGFYTKFGLGCGMEVNNIAFGARGDIMVGYLNKKTLPNEIQIYKNTHNRVIDDATISLFFQVRMK